MVWDFGWGNFFQLLHPGIIFGDFQQEGLSAPGPNAESQRLDDEVRHHWEIKVPRSVGETQVFREGFSTQDSGWRNFLRDFP